MSHIQRPTGYGDRRIDESGAHVRYKPLPSKILIFERVLRSYVQGIKSVLGRVVGARPSHGRVAETGRRNHHTLILNAKLVGRHAIRGMGEWWRAYFPREKSSGNSTQPNRQSFRAFNPAIAGIKRVFSFWRKSRASIKAASRINRVS